MDWNETQRINLSAILRKPEGAELRVMPESPQITLFFLVMSYGSLDMRGQWIEDFKD